MVIGIRTPLGVTTRVLTGSRKSKHFPQDGHWKMNWIFGQRKKKTNRNPLTPDK